MNIIIGETSFLSQSLEIYFSNKKINFEKLNLNKFLKYNLQKYKNNHIKIFYLSGFNSNQKKKFVEHNVNKIEKFIKCIKSKNINCTIYYPSSIYVNSRGKKTAYLNNYIKAKKKIEKLLITSSTKNIKVWIGRLPSIVRKDFKYLVFSKNSFFNSIINNFQNNKVITIDNFKKRDIVYSKKLFDYLIESSFHYSKNNFKIEHITNNNPFDFNEFYKKLIKINSNLRKKFVIQSFASDNIKFANIKNKKKCGNFPTYQLMCDSLFYQINKLKNYDI